MLLDRLRHSGVLSRFAGRVVQRDERAATIERLRREAEVLERMVSVVGHDLRSPLSAIILTAQGLAETTPSPAVDRIQRSALRMQRMIRGLLDVSRVRHAGGLPIEPEPSDLAALIADEIDELHRVHPDRELRTITCGDPCGSWDPVRIGELLSNLIGNAIRHGAGGPIEVSCAGDGETVELRVKNQGGIPRAARPHLFEPFQAGTRSCAGEGLGLGLFICRAIVLAHGGTIAAAGDGDTTEMIVRLPRRGAR